MLSQPIFVSTFLMCHAQWNLTLSCASLMHQWLNIHLLLRPLYHIRERLTTRTRKSRSLSLAPLALSLPLSLCSPITVAEIAISRQLPQIGFLNWWQTQRSAHCGAGTGTGTGTGTGRGREGTFSQLVLELQQLLLLPLLSAQLCRENEMHIKFTQPACGV